MICLTQDSMEVREGRNVGSDFDRSTGKVQRGVSNDLLFDSVLFFGGRDSGGSKLLQLNQTVLQASKSFGIDCHPCPCKIGNAWSQGDSHSLRREAWHLL